MTQWTQGAEEVSKKYFHCDKLHKNYFEICENLNKDNQVNQFNQDNVDNQKNEDKLNKNFTFSQDYKPERMNIVRCPVTRTNNIKAWKALF